MDRLLPLEIICRILSMALNAPSNLVNFSDDRHSVISTMLLAPEDIDSLPTFDDSRLGLTHEISFFNWPVDFHHNVPAYRLHQRRAMTCILVSKLFRAILTPMLYQFVLITTSRQARRLASALEDEYLAALVKTIVVCPMPVYYPTQALLDSVVDACPNLTAFHNFSRSHSQAHASRAIVPGAITPATGGITRLTHNPLVIFQLERHPSICNALVFLEITNPSCHWTKGLPILAIALPSLSYLKMEKRVDTINMMQDCAMPALEHLCFTRPMYRADIGDKTRAFLLKHGSKLTQLEYPEVIWSGTGGGTTTTTTTLEAVCPALKQLIVDPAHCIDSTAPLAEQLFCGPHGHSQVSDIGLRNIAIRVAYHSDSAAGKYVTHILKSLVDTRAFPMLYSVRDMAWRRDEHHTQPIWRLVAKLCTDRNIVFKDWSSKVVT